MRDQSKKIGPGMLAFMPGAFKSTGEVTPLAKRHGACACSRFIVPGIGTKEAGSEKHSRRRCTFRKDRTIVRGARW